MIRHVYDCAGSCPDISQVYVVTDDERIFACVKDFGGKALMTGKEHASGSDRIAEAVQTLGLSEKDLIVNIQGDQPVFHPSVISDMLSPLMQDEDILMSTLKFRIADRKEAESSNIVKVVTDDKGFALYFSRCPIPFFRDDESHPVHYKHLGFYAFRRDFLIRFSRLSTGRIEHAEKLEQLRALEHGFRIRVVESAFDSVEVDAPEDIIKVEEILKKRDDPE